MNRFRIFITGRLISLVVLLSFNILIIRLLNSYEYSTYAVLFALASVANTLGSLGSQRFIPKYVAPAQRDDNARVARYLIIRFFALRILAALVATGLCIFLYSTWLQHSVRIVNSATLPLVAISVVSAMYTDLEIVSQSLNQQRISRFVSVSEPILRTCLVISSIWYQHELTGIEMLALTALSQGYAIALLGANALLNLKQKIRSSPQRTQMPPNSEILGIASSSYISGLTYLISSPATIRLIAATIISMPELAALSFVQTITLSLQRYSPGFILFPFIEPTIMGWQATGDPKRYDRAAATLSLIVKVDAILITLAIAAISPVAGEILVIMAGKSIDPNPIVLLLGMAVIIGSTVVRSCEIAASFSAAYSAVFSSSLVSIFLLLLLFFGGQYLGLIGILSFPVVDALARAFIIGQGAKKNGFRTIIDWRIVGLCNFCILVIILISKYWLAPYGISSVGKLLYCMLFPTCITVLLSLAKPITTIENELLSERISSKSLLRLLSLLSRH